MAFYGTAVALSLWLMVRARQKVAGTTLSAVWWWALAAICAVAAVELALWYVTGEGRRPTAAIPAWASAARYAAAVLALCPTVALLGAKRPQDRAWQWVVLAFWAAMIVPAARAYFLQGGSSVALHTAQGAFLLVVAAMGVANWIATRFAVAAAAAGATQFLLVSPYTPLERIVPFVQPTAAMFGTTVALLVCRWLEGRVPQRGEIERQWLDFRDRYGLFWAARVMARLNAAAAAHRWPVTIQWSNVRIDAAADERARAAAERSLRMLLRRFVSPEWLSANERAA